MGRLNVYHDDHEPSVLSSLMTSRARWQLLYIHLTDGTVLETDFRLIDHHKANLPSKPLYGNDDGIAVYVTAKHSADGHREEIEEVDSAFGYSITYIPRDRIERFKVSWIGE